MGVCDDSTARRGGRSTPAHNRDVGDRQPSRAVGATKRGTTEASVSSLSRVSGMKTCRQLDGPV
eukprot:ctg_3625.g562